MPGDCALQLPELGLVDGICPRDLTTAACIVPEAGDQLAGRADAAGQPGGELAGAARSAAPSPTCSAPAPAVSWPRPLCELAAAAGRAGSMPAGQLGVAGVQLVDAGLQLRAPPWSCCSPLRSERRDLALDRRRDARGPAALPAAVLSSLAMPASEPCWRSESAADARPGSSGRRAGCAHAPAAPRRRRRRLRLRAARCPAAPVIAERGGRGRAAQARSTAGTLGCGLRRSLDPARWRAGRRPPAPGRRRSSARSAPRQRLVEPADELRRASPCLSEAGVQLAGARPAPDRSRRAADRRRTMRLPARTAAARSRRRPDRGR